MLHSLPFFQIRSLGEGVVEGLAAGFGGVDSYGDSIRAGAFAASLAKHKAAGTVPAMLWSHKSDSPIGHWTTLNESSRGLQVIGQLNLKTTLGREAYESTKAGDMTGLSIGYIAEESEVVDGINYLTEIQLHEVSVVAIPADTAARISAVKSLTTRPTNVREFQALLTQAGFSRREAHDIAAKGAGALFDDLEPAYSSADIARTLSAIKAATHQWNSI